MQNKSLCAVFCVCFCLLSIFSFTAFAANSELDYRILKARQVIDDIMISPDNSIPEEYLAKCEAIAIYPSVIKGGFVFGGRYGRGVILKHDKRTGKWGPVAFSTIAGGSWGLQIGAQFTDLILVVMNQQGLESVLSTKVILGGETSVAAGPVGRSASAATDIALRSGIISYCRTKGLFAGLALDGAVLTQDSRSNFDYYGQSVSSKDILLDRKVMIQPSSDKLVEALNKYSLLWNKRIARGKK